MKKADISKSRIRRIDRRDKETKRNRPKEKSSFREGAFLSWLYTILAALVALGCGIFTYSMDIKVLYTNLPPIFIFTTTAFIIVSFLIRRLNPEVLRRNSRISLVAVIFALSMVLNLATFKIFESGIFVPSYVNYSTKELQSLTPFIMPYLFAPTLLTLLLGFRTAVSIGCGMSLIYMIFYIGACPNQTILSFFLSTVVLPYIVDKAHRRSHILKAFLITSFIVFIINLMLSVATTRLLSAPEDFLFIVSAVLISSSIVFVLDIMLLPMFEHFFGMASNIRLNEYSDLSHPLLQELSQKAEGTFHHCMQVGTMAGNAAKAISANSLLARVGGYYHDIGKISNPQFFIENAAVILPKELDDNSIRSKSHSGLSPSMSALLIKGHVKDGEGFALHYNLPPSIRDIIKQHHGTTLIAYFYNKACENAEKKATQGESVYVDESLYHYPGPKPDTKESAIVMLADSIEAASRSLEHPTPAKIEGLINDIVNQKILDGQLDNCPITTSDIRKIKQVFTTTLKSSLHIRIPYPKPPSETPNKDNSDDNVAQNNHDNSKEASNNGNNIKQTKADEAE